MKLPYITMQANFEIYRVSHKGQKFKDGIYTERFLTFMTPCYYKHISLFNQLKGHKKLKTSTFKASYNNSFMSSLQSLPVWVTRYFSCDIFFLSIHSINRGEKLAFGFLQYTVLRKCAKTSLFLFLYN